MGVIIFANRIAKPRGHTATANFSSPQATASVCTGLGGGRAPQDPTGHRKGSMDPTYGYPYMDIHCTALYSTVQYCTVLYSTVRTVPCFGMNDHPGRDTDVRSRPSESTIKDLSFYIGFTRIQSSIKHLGPCFGMNGHSRRDPDMISRLPDTTSHFLSVFIGFEC